MKRNLVISLLLAVFLLSGCKAVDLFYDLAFEIAGKFPTQTIALQTASEKIELKVEVADREKERERGLMNREKLDEGRGMWFVFQDEAPRTFWMKNTLIPLDLLLFNSKKEIVDKIENLEPCKIPQCPTYTSQIPAMYALELPAGYIKKKGIKNGDKIVENK